MPPNDRLSAMATAPLGPLLARFSWPALVSMTLNALYAVIDRIWIGHGCGQDAMAALTLAFPLMMVFGAFGVFVGAGHGALISIKLGEGDRPACEKLLGELVAFKLLFFCILPPLVFVFVDPILRWTGGSGVTPAALEQAKTYVRLVVFSHLFSHLAFGLSATMRSEGAVVPSMMCMVVGFGTNLLLDPLFIFGFGMGVAGAAWATNIAMFLSCAWALWYYRPGHSAVRLRWRRIRFYSAFALRAAGIGLSPALQQLMGSLINVSLQLAFARWASGQSAATAQIASLGIFQMATLLFFMLLFTISAALSTNGITANLATTLTQHVKGGPTGMIPLVVLISSLGSAFVDNIVFVAAFTPVVQELMKMSSEYSVLWWALLFGACYGGNITVVGSTANIVASGLLEKHGQHPIKFSDWIKIGAMVGLVTGIVAWLMLLIMPVPKPADIEAAPKAATVQNVQPTTPAK